MAIQLRAIAGEPMSAVEKARALEDQARNAAMTIAWDVIKDLEEIAKRCAEASELTAVAPGVRDVLRKQADSIQANLDTVAAIQARS